MATIPYSSVITTERLPVDAQNVVTKVRLVVAGNRAGREPDRHTVYDNGTGGMITYFADPIVHVYEAPEHTDYGCERSFALPEGFNPFLSPDAAPAPELVHNFVNADAIRDGIPTTFATLADGVDGLIKYGVDAGYLGFKLLMQGYQTELYGQAEVTIRMGRIPRFLEGAETPFGSFYQFDLPVDGNLDNDHDMYAVLPHEVRNQPVNGGSVVPDSTLRLVVASGMAGVKVGAFYPLILNTALLEEVAKANVRLPAMTPARVTVTGYVEPDREHTISGWPGGDYTGRVAQYQYDLGRTIIDFEQAGAPTGLPAEAIETARERKVATDAIVSTMNYSLKMGERQ